MKWIKPKKEPPSRINFSPGSAVKSGDVPWGAVIYGSDLSFRDRWNHSRCGVDGQLLQCLPDMPGLSLHQVSGAWLDELINAGEGVEISLFQLSPEQNPDDPGHYHSDRLH